MQSSRRKRWFATSNIQETTQQEYYILKFGILAERDSGLNRKSGKCRAVGGGEEIQKAEGVYPPTKRRQHHWTIREVKGTIKERKGIERKEKKRSRRR